AFAIGGMAAFIPTKSDAEINTAALAKVRADKEREANAGYDGSWVAHPGLVSICAEEFDRVLGDRPNQLGRPVSPAPAAVRLLDTAGTPGAVTEAGVRGNVSVSLRYLVSWLGGNGAAAIDNLMEDAATVEISRSQLWQWIHHATSTDTGTVVTRQYVTTILDEELSRLRGLYAADADALQRLEQAHTLFAEVVLDDEYVDFLTLPAYAEFVP
ncbi:MAG: malate synthase A, partial [Jiangellaceae bacterium]